jgi:hypothetical protein
VLAPRGKLLEAAADGRLLAIWQTAALAMERRPFPELQAMVRAVKEKHYRGWLDERIPALGGLTPREAAPRGPAAGRAAARRRWVAEGARAGRVRRRLREPVRHPRAGALPRGRGPARAFTGVTYGASADR